MPRFVSVFRTRCLSYSRLFASNLILVKMSSKRYITYQRVFFIMQVLGMMSGLKAKILKSSPSQFIVHSMWNQGVKSFITPSNTVMAWCMENKSTSALINRCQVLLTLQRGLTCDVTWWHERMRCRIRRTEYSIRTFAGDIYLFWGKCHHIFDHNFNIENLYHRSGASSMLIEAGSNRSCTYETVSRGSIETWMHFPFVLWLIFQMIGGLLDIIPNVMCVIYDDY